ncbi:plant UBX domain-containing protein 1 isoform X1 [Lycium barbarum]|uniref:plant UBX domain-containing protein 1 isoform X1 n=1 Tax=Lycium barbarum TaxID=112863 RepID=UPI00293E9A5B|nr:plant UBX domain-containing protein 1 isoform X1 [Lycium barbarum]
MRADSIASSIKRQRFTTVNPMELESAKVKLAAAKEKFGREIRVFETAPASSTASDISSNVSEEPEDFYEFTPEDYYRLLGTKKEEKHLKTKKIREEEEAARKARITARITKAVIRVRFPDNYTLEATFHPSETIQSLLDLLMKVITHPELPFYIYTTPPKKQIKDASQDFYSAGFIPGAIVYFSYNLPKVYRNNETGEVLLISNNGRLELLDVDGFRLGDSEGDDGAAASGPYLQEEVMSLLGLDTMIEKEEPGEPSRDEPPKSDPPASVPDQKPAADKKKIKPKWLKL